MGTVNSPVLFFRFSRSHDVHRIVHYTLYALYTVRQWSLLQAKEETINYINITHIIIYKYNTYIFNIFLFYKYNIYICFLIYNNKYILSLIRTSGDHRSNCHRVVHKMFLLFFPFLFYPSVPKSGNLLKLDKGRDLGFKKLLFFF